MGVLSLSRREGDVPGPSGSGAAEQHRNDTLAGLRRQMAVMSGTPDRRTAEPVSVDVLPVSDELAEVLPQRGIVRGGILCYTGARSLLMSLIATVTAGGGQIGIVGVPGLNLASAVEMGADLERIAVVAEPGVDPVEVASVLLDGMDLVILGLGGVSVPPSRCRVVGGRARQQSSSLIAVGGVWPGAHTRLDVRVIGYRHRPTLAGRGDLADARSGHGHLAGMRLRVVAEGRDRRRRDTEIEFVAGDFGDDRVLIRRLDATFGSVGSEPDVAVAN
ncbi:hypothetical protein ABLE92_00970 [Gordonia sp. VNQ95]|jgi:hypothetical protein|uniref:hypothetical protein n=1 Tax=Gordonia TaxID=2053 RepID=UPI0032B473BB